MVSFLVIIICVIYYFVLLYPRVQNPEHRMYLMCMFLGLVTYLIHGILNNFLDTDKASAPFWGFIAAIVAIEVYHVNAPKKQEVDSIEPSSK